MWQTHRLESLPHLHKFQLTANSTPLTYAEVLALWESSEAFRTFFIALLASSPFTAFRWETPPLTVYTRHRPFEFVLHDAPRLPKTGDPQAFAEHFNPQCLNAGALAFRNLGNDATLIVPTPLAAPSAYPHLAAFLRLAPVSQQHALWQLVAQTVQHHLSVSPLWLSTAGMGVPWLHIRLDSRPKYYGHVPYTTHPHAHH
jgi:hypothetical protein